MAFNNNTLHCTENEGHHCGHCVQILVSSILSCALVVVFLLGLPGNMIALYVFCRNIQYWTPTILLLFNLVLADFLLLLSLPFRIDYYLRSENWVFGSVWCRVNLFMLAVNRSASISFMSALAVDRYFKIVRPHHKVNHMSSYQAAGIACIIWIVVMSLRIPLLTNELLSEVNNASFCRSFSSYKNPTFGIKLHYLVYNAEFFFSLILLLFCSCRIYCVFHQRQLNTRKNVRRAIRTVLVIIAVFIICFCPGVATGLSALFLQKLGTKYCELYLLNAQLFVISLGFTYLNSVLDPIIYGFSSSMFRDALKRSVYQIAVKRTRLLSTGSTTIQSDSSNRL